MNGRFVSGLGLDNLPDDKIEIIEIDDFEVEILDVDDDFSVKDFKPTTVKESFLTKVRKKLSKNKIAIATLSCVTVMITLTGVFLIDNGIQKTFNNQSNMVYTEVNDNILFDLNDTSYNTVDVYGEYEEKGAQLVIGGVDYSSDISIDTSNLDLTKVGTYQVIYTYPISKNQVLSLYRTINVVDTLAPDIKLLGSNVYNMLVGDEFIDEGVLVSDNSFEDLIDKVVVQNNIGSNPGVYDVVYTVSDSSGNTSSVVRKVNVKYSYLSSSNTILANSFNDNGIFFKGCVQDNSFTYQILLKNKDNGDEFIIDVDKTSNHYYSLNLDVSNFSNGTYEFYLINDSLEVLTNNLPLYNRIVRSHIGDKLVTMSYEKGSVNMTISDFTYLYDVVIDPGHGGCESGAVNGRYVERDINLEQSLYEKKRYEEHGLKVLLLRDSNSDYGIMMGDSSWNDIDRKGFAVGYYGSVSKIVYSNHHNSSSNTSSAGWEILVPSGASYDDLFVEHKIADVWSNMYIKQTNPYYRFYTKDFETATPTNKMNGEVYSFDDYYAVIRIPNKLFNVKNVLFEGAYVNNNSDMRWYYDNANWVQLSEAKIKAYVESIGVTYIAP